MTTRPERLPIGSLPTASHLTATKGPRLVPPLHPKPIRSPLALWHLLSLDAPSVATAWTLLVARSACLHLPWVESAAMFMAVWMIYAADRLLDARLLDTNPSTEGLEERHHFHHAHRRAFRVGILLASLILVFLLHHADPSALHLYALLATLLGVWMLLIHLGSGTGGQRLPKEIAVGLFFPAAIFIPTVSRMPALRETLLPAAALFAAVCALNCLLIYAWEHPHARSGPGPVAHTTTRWAATHLNILIAMVFSAACIGSLLHRHGPVAAPALACTLSATLLWTLDRVHNKFSPIHLRALADLVLLTPLLWLLR